MFTCVCERVTKHNSMLRPLKPCLPRRTVAECERKQMHLASYPVGGVSLCMLSPVSAAPLFEVRGPLATSGVPSAGRKGQTLATSVVGNHRWSFLQPDEARLYLPPPHKAGKRGRRWVMKAREARLSCQQPCRGFPPKVWPPTIDGGFIWFIWNRPGQ